MHPKSLKFSWKTITSFPEAITLNSVIYTTRQCNRDVSQLIPPQYLKKYTPMFEPGFLPLINDHSFRYTPSPPPYNDRVCHVSVPTRENFPLHHW